MEHTKTDVCSLTSGVQGLGLGWVVIPVSAEVCSQVFCVEPILGAYLSMLPPSLTPKKTQERIPMSRDTKVEELVKQSGSEPPRLMLASSRFSRDACA